MLTRKLLPRKKLLLRYFEKVPPKTLEFNPEILNSVVFLVDARRIGSVHREDVAVF